MDDVIQRLRASKLDDESNVANQGREAGREWAKHNAEYVELKRLARAMANKQPNDPELFIVPEGNAYAGCEVFVFTIRPDADGDRREACEFWEFLDQDCPDDEFVQAFAEGVLEIWHEVSDKL